MITLQETDYRALVLAIRAAKLLTSLPEGPVANDFNLSTLQRNTYFNLGFKLSFTPPPTVTARGDSLAIDN